MIRNSEINWNGASATNRKVWIVCFVYFSVSLVTRGATNQTDRWTQPGSPDPPLNNPLWSLAQLLHSSRVLGSRLMAGIYSFLPPIWMSFLCVLLGTLFPLRRQQQQKKRLCPWLRTGDATAARWLPTASYSWIHFPMEIKPLMEPENLGKVVMPSVVLKLCTVFISHWDWKWSISHAWLCCFAQTVFVLTFFLDFCYSCSSVCKVVLVVYVFTSQAWSQVFTDCCILMIDRIACARLEFRQKIHTTGGKRDMELL